MAPTKSGSKLPRGVASKLARRFKLKLSHVSRVVRGERKGRPTLMQAIERERQKQQQQNAA